MTILKIEEQGEAFYRLCCESDLEGIVAKAEERGVSLRTKAVELDQDQGQQELFAGETLEKVSAR